MYTIHTFIIELNMIIITYNFLCFISGYRYLSKFTYD